MPDPEKFLHDRQVPILVAYRGKHSVANLKVVYQSTAIINTLLEAFVARSIIDQKYYYRANTELIKGD